MISFQVPYWKSVVAYDLGKLLSDFGGNAGLFIGASFISFFDLFIEYLEKVKRFFKRN